MGLFQTPTASHGMMKTLNDCCDKQKLDGYQREIAWHVSVHCRMEISNITEYLRL